MARLKLYIAAQDSKLYIAAMPRTQQDQENQHGDEWLLTAVQLYPNSTVEELLPHIELLREKKHPEQLLSKVAPKMLTNVSDTVMINPVRLHQQKEQQAQDEKLRQHLNEISVKKEKK